MADRFEVPVVIIFFNRPDLVEKQFRVMQQLKCANLFLIADGPRNEADRVKLEICKSIWKHIDWKCEVIEIYAEHNLGCDVRIKTGLDEVFQEAEEAIILEDDCIASMDFFPYCQYLLDKYRDTSEISFISGSNQVKNYAMKYSYDYIAYAWTWGWATWRRAWTEQKDLFQDINRTLKDLQQTTQICKADRNNKKKLLKEYYDSGQILPWDYNFTLSMVLQNKISIVPCVNLITNCGFTEAATHTQTELEGYDGRTGRMEFPLTDPLEIKINKTYQYRSFRFLCPGIITKIGDRKRWQRWMGRIIKRGKK